VNDWLLLFVKCRKLGLLGHKTYAEATIIGVSKIVGGDRIFVIARLFIVAKNVVGKLMDWRVDVAMVNILAVAMLMARSVAVAILMGRRMAVTMILVITNILVEDKT